MESETEMRERINEARAKRGYPNPSVNTPFYVERKMCPICYDPTTDEDMLHPNDIRKKLRIHDRCWKFIRAHWICRGCNNYFSEKETSYRLPETGERCKECFDSLVEKFKYRVVGDARGMSSRK